MVFCVVQRPKHAAHLKATLKNLTFDFQSSGLCTKHGLLGLLAELCLTLDMTQPVELVLLANQYNI